MKIPLLGGVARSAGVGYISGDKGMKILAIMGSPKGKGSGYHIVRMIEGRMKAMGHVEFEYLFLKDTDLKPCTGCYACMARGEDKCPLKDGRAAIEQKLLTADGVILSSPVYVSNVSWLMKIFIDRFAYTKHRPNFHRQKVLAVVNMAGTEKDEALSSLSKVLGGARIVHELAVSTPQWLQTERAVAHKERTISAAAKKFYLACLDTSLPKPTFKSYMNFFIYKKLSLECRQYLPADHAFYRGRKYYYDTNVNTVKALAAKVVTGIMMYMYVRKGMGPGSVTWPMAGKEE